MTSQNEMKINDEFKSRPMNNEQKGVINESN